MALRRIEEGLLAFLNGTKYVRLDGSRSGTFPVSRRSVPMICHAICKIFPEMSKR